MQALLLRLFFIRDSKNNRGRSRIGPTREAIPLVEQDGHSSLEPGRRTVSGMTGEIGASVFLETGGTAGEKGKPREPRSCQTNGARLLSTSLCVLLARVMPGSVHRGGGRAFKKIQPSAHPLAPRPAMRGGRTRTRRDGVSQRVMAQYRACHAVLHAESRFERFCGAQPPREPSGADRRPEGRCRAWRGAARARQRLRRHASEAGRRPEQPSCRLRNRDLHRLWASGLCTEMRGCFFSGARGMDRFARRAHPPFVHRVWGGFAASARPAAAARTAAAP